MTCQPVRGQPETRHMRYNKSWLSQPLPLFPHLRWMSNAKRNHSGTNPFWHLMTCGQRQSTRNGPSAPLQGPLPFSPSRWVWPWSLWASLVAGDWAERSSSRKILLASPAGSSWQGQPRDFLLKCGTPSTWKHQGSLRSGSLALKGFGHPSSSAKIRGPLQLVQLSVRTEAPGWGRPTDASPCGRQGSVPQEAAREKEDIKAAKD